MVQLLRMVQVIISLSFSFTETHTHSHVHTLALNLGVAQYLVNQGDKQLTGARYGELTRSPSVKDVLYDGQRSGAGEEKKNKVELSGGTRIYTKM